MTNVLDEHGAYPSGFCCLAQLLEHQAQQIPEAAAILASGRPPLTYRRLFQQTEKIGRVLRAKDLGREQRAAQRGAEEAEKDGAVLVAGEARLLEGSSLFRQGRYPEAEAEHSRLHFTAEGGNDAEVRVP